MRFVLLGAGSVGQRHFRNVLGLGQDIAVVCDPNPAALETVKHYGLGAMLTAEESEALAQDADGALICSPTACHLRQARMAVHHGFHVFIEKPLAHTLEGTMLSLPRQRPPAGSPWSVLTCAFSPACNL